MVVLESYLRDYGETEGHDIQALFKCTVKSCYIWI